MADLASIVSDIPGATTALQYLAGKAREFRATGPRLLKLMHTAAAAKYQATQAGNVQAAQDAAASLANLSAIKGQWDTWDDRLAPVYDWLDQNGFGFVPVIVAVAAVAALAAVTYILAQTNVEAKKLDLVAKGVLTPQQLTDLNNASSPSLVNFDFGSLLPWLAVGAGLWWWVGHKQRGGRGGGIDWL